MTAFGIFIQDFLQFRTRYLPEMFGITRSSALYHRLGKLFMLLLTSGEMKKRLCDILKLWLHEPAGIQTTSITVHEEGKTDQLSRSSRARIWTTVGFGSSTGRITRFATTFRGPRERIS